MLQRTVLSFPSGARLNCLYVFNSLICTFVCMLFFTALCCAALCVFNKYNTALCVASRGKKWLQGNIIAGNSKRGIA